MSSKLSPEPIIRSPGRGSFSLMTGFKDRLRRRLAPLVYGDGLAVIPPAVNHSWPQRQFLRRFLKRLEIDCLLDVGANIGQYATEVRNIGYQGLIFSFEPDPDCFAKLSARSAADPSWHAFNIALGSAVGSADFNVMEVPLFNSFRAPSTADTAHFGAPNSVQKVITVRVETLADQLPELQRQFGFRRTFLKMDTQGFDVEVFRGARPVHDRIAGMQSEVSVKRLYADTPDWRSIIAEYEQAGFELAGLYAVNAELDELMEFDCYLRRIAA
jgi:FkbM family methyltransferase